jgi:hypothetical protein
MSKFKHHKYTWSKPFLSVRHCWEFVGPNGAVHFSANLTEGYGTTCGLEFHSLSGEGAPHHLNCHLTGGRCWHDGTSLYADESVWPALESMLRHGDHEGIFRLLEWEYERHFERDVEPLTPSPKPLKEDVE